MSDRDHPPVTNEPETLATGAPPVGARLGTTTPAPAAEAAAAAAEESTVGTGTSIALGCVAGTIVLILVGLAILGIVALVG